MIVSSLYEFPGVQIRKKPPSDLNERALRAAAEVEDARGVEAVVLADVVTDDRVFVVRIPRRADQEEAAFVVVTVIVLKQRTATAVIGIKSLPVLRAFQAGDFVELNHRVVAVERPDARG